MRILHLIQRPQFRGTEVFAGQLARAHREEGHEVRLIALFPFGGPRTFQDNGQPIEILGANPGRRLLDRKGWKRLAERIRAFQPDIVQANAADTLKYAVFSRITYGWKVPLLYRNASVVSQWIKSPIHAAYNKWLLARVDAIASVSEASKQDLEQYFGLSGDRLAVIPNATPIPEHLDRKKAKEKLGQELGLPREADLLLHVGAFTAEKNQIGLLDIFQEVRRQTDRELYLLLVGDGPLKGMVEAQSASLELSDRVFFLGNRPDVPDLLQAATLLLLPSTIEGLPGVILEAMAHRTPVVASPVGGIPEAIEDNQIGRLTNLETFSAPVLELLRDREQRETLAQNAFQKVCRDYHIESIARRFADLYHQMIIARAPI